MAEPPDVEHIVQEERNKYPATHLTADQCAELTNAIAWRCRDQDYGVNGKDFGNYGIRHDGTKIAVDILHHKSTNHLIDILIAAGDRTTRELGVATATWNDHGPNPHSNRPFIDAIAPIGSQPKNNCALGVSFFPALGLRRHDRTRYNQFMDFHKILKPDYARVMYYLDDSWWSIVGTGHFSDIERRGLLRTVIEELLDINVQPQLTVFGSWVPDSNRRDDLIGQFKDVTRPYVNDIFLVDCYNEPGAIGVPEYGYVRQCGFALTGMGFKRLSLASPNSLHMGVAEGNSRRRATDVEVILDTTKLYGGMPNSVNTITPHWSRNPWERRDLGQSAIALKIINDEPRGFKSSVSEIRDPKDFGGDYSESSRLDDDGYSLHGESGVWCGYCDAPGDNNEYPTWQDVPRIDEIINELHKVRGGGISGGGSGNHMAKHPYPQEANNEKTAYWQVFERRLSEVFAKKGITVPPEALESGRFFARTAWDLADSLTPEESAEKHLKEIADLLGVEFP